MSSSEAGSGGTIDRQAYIDAQTADSHRVARRAELDKIAAFSNDMTDKPDGVSAADWMAFKEQTRWSSAVSGKNTGSPTEGAFSDFFKQSLNQERITALTKGLSGRSGTILGNSVQTQDATKIGKTLLTFEDAKALK
jgi:hypothetical protein